MPYLEISWSIWPRFQYTLYSTCSILGESAFRDPALDRHLTTFVGHLVLKNHCAALMSLVTFGRRTTMAGAITTSQAFLFVCVCALWRI